MTTTGQWNGTDPLTLVRRPHTYTHTTRTAHLAPNGQGKALCGAHWRTGWHQGSGGHPVCRTCLILAWLLNDGTAPPPP